MTALYDANEGHKMQSLRRDALGADLPDYEISFCCLHCHTVSKGITHVGYYLYPTDKYCDCISVESLTTRLSRLRSQASRKHRSAEEIAGQET
jgi:hypothetical protein